MIGRWENHLSATWEFQHKCKHKNNKRQLIIKLYYEEGDVSFLNNCTHFRYTNILNM